MKIVARLNGLELWDNYLNLSSQYNFVLQGLKSVGHWEGRRVKERELKDLCFPLPVTMVFPSSLHI